MVMQKQVMAALRELGGRATVTEIVDHMHLKKQLPKAYSYGAASTVNRILTALKNWQEVDRIIHSQKEHPKTTTQDIWFIKK